MRNLKRSWADLPLEKKLGSVIVPLLVAAIGAGVPLLLAGGEDGSSEVAQHGSPSSQLEMIDLAVTGGSPRGNPQAIQRIDLTVRNAGDLVSIVKRIGFRVRASGLLKICQAGGGLEPSERYRVMLPPNPMLGQLVKAKVSTQIKSGDADRFTVGLDVPDPARQEGDRLYQLDVLLYHDTAQEPVRAGTVLVSAPYLPDKYYFWSGYREFSRSDLVGDPAGRRVAECLDNNEAVLKKMLNLDGERSAGLSLTLLRGSG